MLKHAEPARYTLAVETVEDMACRVVRSTSASLEIPELGVRIDPGPQCQGFISNVEGVLDRVEEVVRMALRWGTDVEKENAAALIADIARVKAGLFPVTLIMEDPNGNSAIEAGKATKENYAPEPE
jgi:zinc finger protein